MADSIVLSRWEQYRRNRRRFAYIVYSLAAVFFVCSLVQWILMIKIADLRDFIIQYYYIWLVALCISMLSVTAFVFFENLRFITPLNWLITLLILLMTTWGISRAIVVTNLAQFGYTILFVIGVTLLFILLGVFCTHDFTLDVVILFVVAIIFFIASAFFVMLQLLAGIKISFYIYTTLIIVNVVMFTTYHAQTINGFRYAEMRLNDYLLAALIIYHDMTLLLIMSIFLIGHAVGDGLRLLGEKCCQNSTIANATARSLIAPIDFDDNSLPLLISL